MMNLLVHSLMDDDAGLEVALESALKHQVQVLFRVFYTNMSSLLMVDTESVFHG